jgi:SRSO17 transposase
VAAVTSTFGVRLPEEVVRAAERRPAYQGRGQPPKPRPAALYTAEAVLAALPAAAWQPITWRERPGTPLRRQCVALRVHWATGSPLHTTSHSRVQTGPEGWLVGTRPLPGDDGEAKYYFLTLPAETPLQRLVELVHSRWPIEQFYEDSKGECGLDDYQGRRWDGLHRHLALVMLAYSYLVWQRLALTPASPTGAGLSPL